jgi:transcriptional activator of cad operon
MEQPANKLLRIGDWCVDPSTGQISRNGDSARLEARTMRLLLCLAEHSGEVVSIDDLLNEVWAGVIVTPDSVYQAVASLRRLLRDDPKRPAYIATVPRLGYRMIAPVEPWSNGVALPRTPSPPGNDSPPVHRSKVSRAAGAFTVLLILLLVGGLSAFLVDGRSRKEATPPRAGSRPVPPAGSVAVLPFLDLTPGMREEEFADGITEEVIDKLSRLPGLSVPSATASFYYKGKQTPVSEIAKSLGVTYVLDGSVRKSGTWIRVDTRLVRADNGYVVWSQTYDQPEKNMLMIQDDIAGAVAASLRSSIGSHSSPNP